MRYIAIDTKEDGRPTILRHLRPRKSHQEKTFEELLDYCQEELDVEEIAREDVVAISIVDTYERTEWSISK